MDEIDIEFDGVEALLKTLRAYKAAAEKELGQAMEEIAAEWGGEAQDRVPVRSGLTRNTILHESGRAGPGQYFAAVGSNQEHAPHIEFGTKWIAGGKVKALGLSPEITDAQAITSWPAKDENATAGSREQMPFIRPSFMALLPWIQKRLSEVLKID